MGRPRVYATRAEQQKAYRQRAKEQPAKVGIPANAPAQYRNWRKRIAAAGAELAAISEEMHYWRQDRSAEWEETDHAVNIQSAIDDLADLAEQLEGMEL